MIAGCPRRAAKEALANAIEGTATLAGIFSSLRMFSEDGTCPLDSMMTVMNRLLYEQDSKLKHLQMMQIAERKAEQLVARSKARSGTHLEPLQYKEGRIMDMYKPFTNTLNAFNRARRNLQLTVEYIEEQFKMLYESERSGLKSIYDRIDTHLSDAHDDICALSAMILKHKAAEIASADLKDIKL